jgi:hypothetical protein
MPRSPRRPSMCIRRRGCTEKPCESLKSTLLISYPKSTRTTHAVPKRRISLPKRSCSQLRCGRSHATTTRPLIGIWKSLSTCFRQITLRRFGTPASTYPCNSRKTAYRMLSTSLVQGCSKSTSMTPQPRSMRRLGTLRRPLMPTSNARNGTVPLSAPNRSGPKKCSSCSSTKFRSRRNQC